MRLISATSDVAFTRGELYCEERAVSPLCDVSCRPARFVLDLIVEHPLLACCTMSLHHSTPHYKVSATSDVAFTRGELYCEERAVSPLRDVYCSGTCGLVHTRTLEAVPAACELLAQLIWWHDPTLGPLNTCLALNPPRRCPLYRQLVNGPHRTAAPPAAPTWPGSGRVNFGASCLSQHIACVEHIP